MYFKEKRTNTFSIKKTQDIFYTQYIIYYKGLSFKHS